MPNIAYFVTDHGFGHATRACAVMAAIHRIAPAVHFEIFTQTPGRVFEESLTGGFSLHPQLTDIGVAQCGPMHEDLPLTAQRLDAFLPFDPTRIADLVRKIERRQCGLVVCDIAPLGIVVAHAAGRPAVLIENFTWDWIYAGYIDREPRLKAHIAYLQNVFASADYHIAVEPACFRDSAHLVTHPVSRQQRQSREETRARLRLSGEASAVLVTMGGIPETYDFLYSLIGCREVHFIIPGGSETTVRRNNLVLMPRFSEFFHPDLVNACDAVVGKAGYSTAAEVYHAGVPFG